MTERAIDKMVEWLENMREKSRLETKRGQVLAFAHAADKARRLALEEAKEKPVAPASFYEAVEGLLEKTTEFTEEITGETMPVIFPSNVMAVLSRYRPSAQSDIEGHDKPSIPTDKTTGVDQMKFKAE